jgi:pimeloyl-ACP methyl ester carboxylesterase
MPDEELDEQIHWEAEQYIPFDINDVNLYHEVLGRDPSGQSMDVLLVACKRDKIAQFTQVISQAGLLDLQLAKTLRPSNDAVGEMLGDVDLSSVNPVELWPMPARVVIFHGRADTDVPVKIARRAADHAAALGQQHTLRIFDGDHFSWIDPSSHQWEACVKQLYPLHYKGA